MIRQMGFATGASVSVLAAILLIGPLPYAGYGMVARSVLEGAAFLALLLALAGAERSDPASGFSSSGALRTQPLWPFAAVLAVAAWGLAQSLPWPAGLVAWLAPDTAAAWQGARDVLGEDPAALVPLSLAPAVSRETALLWAACAAVGLAGWFVGRRREVRRLLFGSLAASALVQILYGAPRWLRQDTTIWGRAVPGDTDRLRGTFVNPDHLSLFLVVALAMTGAWSWWAMRRALDRGRLETKILLLTLPPMLFLTLFASIAFTGSRAGLVSAVGVLMAQALALATRGSSKRSALPVLGLAAASVVGLGTFGWNRGLARFRETSVFELAWNARLDAWRGTWELFVDAPLVGVGLGAFRQAFPRVQPDRLSGTWQHAHSDLLELLATIGWVAIPWAVVLVGALAMAGRRISRAGRRSEDRAAGLALLGVTAGVLAHSLVDFGMTLPANALAVSLVVGAALGTPIARRGDRPEREPSQTVFLPEGVDTRPWRLGDAAIESSLSGAGAGSGASQGDPAGRHPAAG